MKKTETVFHMGRRTMALLMSVLMAINCCTVQVFGEDTVPEQPVPETVTQEPEPEPTPEPQEPQPETPSTPTEPVQQEETPKEPEPTNVQEPAQEEKTSNNQSDQKSSEEIKKEDEKKDEEKKEEMPAQSFTGAANGITIHASTGEGVFPKDTVMRVAGVNEKSVASSTENVLPDTTEVVDSASVDITFYKDGVEVQPKGNVSLSFQLSNSLEGQEFDVVHIKDNGAPEIVGNASANASGANFTASSFSIYSVIGKDKKQSEDKVRRIYKFYQFDLHTQQYVEVIDQLQIVKNGDTIEIPKDPTSTSDTDDRMFRGWVYAEDDPKGRWSAGQSFTGGVVNDIDDQAEEDEVVKINADFEDAYKIAFFDKAYGESEIDIVDIQEGERDYVANVSQATAILERHLTQGEVVHSWQIRNRAGEIVMDNVAPEDTTSVVLNGVDLFAYPSIQHGHVVTFNANAGSEVVTNLPRPDITRTDGKVDKPADPKREGYTFDGWYRDAEGQTAFNFDSDTITQDTVLYAKWNPQRVSYKIFYWQEVLNDDYSKEKGGTKYKLAESTTVNNVLAGTEISLDSLRGRLPSYNCYDAANDIDESDDGDLKINGDGTSIINVYYPLHEYTLTFNLTHDMNISGSRVSITNHWDQSSTTGTPGTREVYSFKAKLGENLLDKWPRLTHVKEEDHRVRVGGRYHTYTFFMEGWSHPDAKSSDGTTVQSTVKHILTEDFLSAATGSPQDMTFHANYSYSETKYEYIVNYHLQDVQPVDTPDSQKTYSLSPEYDETILAGSGDDEFYPKGIDGFTADTSKTRRRASGRTITYDFYFDRNFYDLNFVSEGNTDYQYRIPYGADLTEYGGKTPKTTKPYNTFGDWYLGDSTTETLIQPFIFDGALMPNANLVVYAHWNHNTVNVSFNVDGTEIESAQVNTHETLDPADIPEEPHKQHNTFMYWDDGNGNHIATSQLDSWIFDEDTTLTAVWEQHDLFRVKYELPEGEKGTVQDDPFFYEDGAHVAVHMLHNQDYPGHNFLGWQLKKKPGTLYHDNDLITITADLGEPDGEHQTVWFQAVYGKGVPVVTNMVFDGNGGKTSDGKTQITDLKSEENKERKTKDVEDNPVDVNNAEWITPGADTFKRAGYKLVGWNTKGDGSGTSYDFNKSIGADTLNEGTDNILYAQWEPESYTIEYDFAGGQAPAVANPTSYIVEDKVTISNEPTRAGYAFEGWTGTGVDAPKKTITFGPNESGNRKYTANWKKCSPVKDDTPFKKVLNGVESVMAPSFTFELKAISTNAPMPEGSIDGKKTVTKTKAGDYDFGQIEFSEIGEYVYQVSEQDSGQPGYTYDASVYEVKVAVTQDGDKLVANRTITKDGAQAQEVQFENSYEPVVYTIEYDFAGGEAPAEANPTSYTVEDKVTIANEPTRSGYVFEGWTGTGVDAPTKTVTFGPKESGNRKYTANWKKCSPVRHDPPIKKTVSGDTPEEAGTFTFTLKAISTTADVEKMPMPKGSDGDVKTTTVQGAGEYEFGIIEFTEVGEYIYQMSEENVGQEGYTYDGSVYEVKYVITQDGDKLVANRTITKDGAEVDEAVFDNVYKKKVDPKPDPKPDLKPNPDKKKHKAKKKKHSVVTGTHNSWMLMSTLFFATLAIMVYLAYRKQSKDVQ